MIKDVVTACDNFDVNKFIPLLRERIRIKNPFIRQLLVGCATAGHLTLPDCFCPCFTVTVVRAVGE